MTLPLDTDIHCDTLADAENLGEFLEHEFPNDTAELREARKLPIPTRLNHLNEGIHSTLDRIVPIKRESPVIKNHWETCNLDASDAKIEAIIGRSKTAIEKLAKQKGISVEAAMELTRNNLRRMSQK